MAVLEKGKHMAKAIALTGDGKPKTGDGKPNRIQGGVQGSWEKTIEFLGDVRGEMRKVVTPSQKEVQATTTVVIVTVFAFAAFFYVVDYGIGHAVQYVLKTLGGVQ
jgi:preprotein translocase subunit SecE